MRSPKKTPPPPTPAAVGSVALSPVAALLVAEANQLTEEEIVPLGIDPLVVEHNVRPGVAAISPYLDHVHEHLPRAMVEDILSLPDLAHLVVTTARDASIGPLDDEARTLFREALALRQILAVSAMALVEAGILGRADGAKVAEAARTLNIAEACATLAGIFARREAESAGKAPVTVADVARAAELAASVRKIFRPKAPRRNGERPSQSPAESAARMFSLLVIRHERLWAIGAYVFGHAVEDHVPPLAAPIPGTRVGRPKLPASAGPRSAEGGGAPSSAGSA